MNGKALIRYKKEKDMMKPTCEQRTINLMTILKIKFHYEKESPPNKEKTKTIWNFSPHERQRLKSNAIIKRKTLDEQEENSKSNIKEIQINSVIENPKLYFKRNHQQINSISKIDALQYRSLERKSPEIIVDNHSTAFLKDLKKIKKEEMAFHPNIPINIIEEHRPFFNTFDKIRKLHNFTQKEFNVTKSSTGSSYLFLVKCKSDKKNILPIMAHRINWEVSKNKNEYNFCWRYYNKKVDYKSLTYNENAPNNQIRVVNLYEKHISLSDKKIMFLNLMNYCNQTKLNVFDYVPFTIIMLTNKETFDHNYNSFTQLFDLLNELNNFKREKVIVNKKYGDLFLCHPTNRKQEIFSNIIINFPETFISNKNFWLIKPNDLYQGKCVKISNDKEKIQNKLKKFFKGINKTFKDSDDENLQNKKEPVVNTVKEYLSDNSNSPKKKAKKNLKYFSTSVILQKYLDKPLLYKNRKFDIRIWTLLDYNQNVFIFKEGHLKASSEEYDVENMDPFIHITNHSVQKKSQNFSKYEYGNEISYKDFQDFLDKSGIGINFIKDIQPKIKDIIELTMNSVKGKLNKTNPKFCFQIFGYDFILDRNFKPWLLEINDNPGLSESSPLIKSLVPRMIDDAFRLTLDKIFNTVYHKSVYNEVSNEYKTKFPVEGYSDSENMFEFICNISNE